MSDQTTNLVSDWLISYPVKSRGEYRRDLDQFSDWLADRPDAPDLIEVDRATVQRWLGHLLDLGRSPATIRRKASAVSSFYTYALEEKVIEHNPCDNLRRPKGDPEPERGLDVHQAKIIIEAAEAHSTRGLALVWLLVGVGLRVAEACRALIEDLDHDQQLLAVTVKGGHRRLKPLSAPVLAGIAPATAERSSGTILTNRDGNPLAPQRAWDLIHTLSKRTGVDCHPHTFRHTAATLALEAGVPVQDVQQLLGHASIETTLRYIQNRDVLGATRQAADRLGSVLTGVNP